MHEPLQVCDRNRKSTEDQYANYLAIRLPARVSYNCIYQGSGEEAAALIAGAARYSDGVHGTRWSHR